MGTRKVRKKREGRMGGKFRAGYNHFRSFTTAPLNLLRDCHFCSSTDEDSSEIQFYLVFQPVGTSELVPFIPADLILSLSIIPFSWPRCSSSPSRPSSTRSSRYFYSQLALLSPSTLGVRFRQCIKRKGLTWLSVKLNLSLCRFP